MNFKCEIKNCLGILGKGDLFSSPSDDKLLKTWQQVIGTKQTDFFVCERHFSKNDLIVEKNLKDEAVPSLYLSHENFKLENRCCGFCLEDHNHLYTITKESQHFFTEITGYEPLTDLMCYDCKTGLDKYKKFQNQIHQKHTDIRNLVAQEVLKDYDNHDDDDCILLKEEFNSEVHQALPETIYCKYCDLFQTLDVKNLLEHLKDKHSFQCDDCRFCSARPAELERHIIQNHILEVNDRRKYLKCDSCGLQGFLSSTFLNLHKERGHNIKIFPCRYCSSIYQGAESLRVHVAHKHPFLSRLAVKGQKGQSKSGSLGVRSKITPLRPLQTTEKLSSLKKLPEKAHQDDPLTILSEAEIKMEPEETFHDEIVEIKVEDVFKVEKEEIFEERDIESILSQSNLPLEKDNDDFMDDLDEMLEEIPEKNDQKISNEKSATISRKEQSVTSKASQLILKESPGTSKQLEQIPIVVPFQESLGAVTYFKLEGKKISKRVKCPECDESMTVEELFVHRNKVHLNYVRCLDCKQFMSVEQLLVHRLTEHKESDDTEKEYPAMPPPPYPLPLPLLKIKKKPVEKLVKCQFCDEEMPFKKFVGHIQQFHGHEPKPYLCEICSKEFILERQFKEHLRSHDPDQMYTCDICGIRNVRKCKISRHILRHHLNIVSYVGQCKICLQKTTKSLKIHMRKHHKKGYDCGARVNSETNYFDCYKCGASYADLFTYRRHDCEKGRYQIRCPDCQRPVKNLENLKIHQENKCYRIDINGHKYKDYKM